MAARDEISWNNVFIKSLICLILALVACVVGYLGYLGWLQLSSGNTEYTVTITGVDGLDRAALEHRSGQAALSPVFDIAVSIDNTRYKADRRCIGLHSSAVVSYGDAVLGKGTVPQFCAKALGLGETTATAWAMDVRMPRFLRSRLAGELERGEAVLDQCLTFRFLNIFRTSQKFENFEKFTKFRRNNLNISARFVIWSSN